MEQQALIAMGLGGQPTTTTPTVPPDAKDGAITVAGELIPTKEWHDNRGHAVHVGDVELGDTYIGGITGHSRRSIEDARGKVKEAVEHVLERMPYSDPDVEITN